MKDQVKKPGATEQDTSSTELLRYDPQHFSRWKGLYFAYKGDQKISPGLSTQSEDDSKVCTVLTRKCYKSMKKKMSKQLYTLFANKTDVCAYARYNT